MSLGSSLSNHKTVHHFLKSSGVAPREFECGSSDKFTQLKLLINSPPSLVSSAEHIFKFLLAICMSSSEECLFRSYAHFLIEVFVFLVLSSVNCLYVLDVNPLSVMLCAYIFFHLDDSF